MAGDDREKRNDPGNRTMQIDAIDPAMFEDITGSAPEGYDDPTMAPSLGALPGISAPPPLPRGNTGPQPAAAAQAAPSKAPLVIGIVVALLMGGLGIVVANLILGEPAPAPAPEAAAPAAPAAPAAEGHTTIELGPIMVGSSGSDDAVDDEGEGEPAPEGEPSGE